MHDPYYITTAISYPNGAPHIGHTYEAVSADVIARFWRARGRDVRFQTGTDEHGLKMARNAKEQGLSARELADQMSAKFVAMCDTYTISYDRFIRTVEQDHHRASQAIWRAMEANGDLYLDRYEGWYSVRDEAYYDESELIAGEAGGADETGEGADAGDDADGAKGAEKLSPQGTPVEWTVEESWFFRLSKYQEPLLELLENQTFLRPKSRRNEMIAFVKGGLRDLSISRTSFDWGVKVPGSENHVMYVWVDALTNYLTGLGFPDETENMAKYWPANVHLIGKDIVRFHAVYWPAFLMSAGLPLPQCVFGHGFLLNRGKKESKSEGNVSDPIALAQEFGVDNLRYFLMREVMFGQDGSYSKEAIVTRCNAELANSFGNLAQRSLSMIYKNMGGTLVIDHQDTEADQTLAEQVSAACDAMREKFEGMAFCEGLEMWQGALHSCNQYVDEQAPWALRKSDPERMKLVLITLFKQLRHLAIMVRPVIPTSTDLLLDQMGIAPDERDYSALNSDDWLARLVKSGFTLEKPVGVFPRLEMPQSEGEKKDASGQKSANGQKGAGGQKSENGQKSASGQSAANEQGQPPKQDKA